jgi:hypothetical protein
MADNPAIAMAAKGREHLDGALEAIEGMGLPVHRDVDALVIGISAAFTRFHGGKSLRRSCAMRRHGTSLAIWVG